MQDTVKANLKSESFWMRTLFMALFLIVNGITKMLTTITTIAQWFFVLLSGTPNQSLLKFASSLSQYIAQIVNYLTYNSETKPFPFSDWPTPKAPEADLEHMD